MHHPISGINSRIHSVSLASHVSTHLLIHLSAHLYYHHHFHHPSLLHSFTTGSKPTFSANPSHLTFLLPTGLPSWQRDTGPIMLIVLFLVSHFNFLFVPCGGLSWLPVSFLLHVKYTLSYRIVSYGPCCLILNKWMDISILLLLVLSFQHTAVNIVQHLILNAFSCIFCVALTRH